MGEEGSEEGRKGWEKRAERRGEKDGRRGQRGGAEKLGKEGREEGRKVCEKRAERRGEKDGRESGTRIGVGERDSSDESGLGLGEGSGRLWRPGECLGATAEEIRERLECPGDGGEKAAVEIHQPQELL